MEEFHLLMNACHKNNIIVDNIDYNEEMGWPIDYIYESIKKYPENRKYFFLIKNGTTLIIFFLDVVLVI